MEILTLESLKVGSFFPLHHGFAILNDYLLDTVFGFPVLIMCKIMLIFTVFSLMPWSGFSFCYNKPVCKKAATIDILTQKPPKIFLKDKQFRIISFFRTSYFQLRTFKAPVGIFNRMAGAKDALPRNSTKLNLWTFLLWFSGLLFTINGTPIDKNYGKCFF